MKNFNIFENLNIFLKSQYYIGHDRHVCMHCSDCTRQKFACRSTVTIVCTRYIKLNKISDIIFKKLERENDIINTTINEILDEKYKWTAPIICIGNKIHLI